MTKTRTVKKTYAKLVKIAQDQLDIANGETNGTLGPQEVVDALVEVVDDLATVVEGVPAEPSADAVEEGDVSEVSAEPEVQAGIDTTVQPEATGAPITDDDEEEADKVAKVRKAAEHPDDDDDKDDKKEKEAKLKTRIAILEQKLAKQELETLAEQFAKEYSNDTRVQQAKFNEILASKKPVSYWSARFEAVEDFKKSNNIQNAQRPAKTFSAYRYAKKTTRDLNEVTL